MGQPVPQEDQEWIHGAASALAGSGIDRDPTPPQMTGLRCQDTPGHATDQSPPSLAPLPTAALLGSSRGNPSGVCPNPWRAPTGSWAPCAVPLAPNVPSQPHPCHSQPCSPWPRTVCPSGPGLPWGPRNPSRSSACAPWQTCGVGTVGHGAGTHGRAQGGDSGEIPLIWVSQMGLVWAGVALGTPWMQLGSVRISGISSEKLGSMGSVGAAGSAGISSSGISRISGINRISWDQWNQ